MDNIIPFDPTKRIKQKTTDTHAQGSDENLGNTQAPPSDTQEKPKMQERYTKAMNYLAYISAQHKHKFSYPGLAHKFPKSTHSIDVLFGHCFTTFGDIQPDMKRFPEIAMAKKLAYERQDEIIGFLKWRLRKYQEAKLYYGNDVLVVDIYLEICERTLSRFKELFKSYGRA